MKKEVKNYLINESENSVSNLLAKKETALALVRLDNVLGIAPIVYNTTLNKANGLAVCALTLSCAYAYAYPNLLSVTSASLICCMSAYLTQDTATRNLRQNIANICCGGQYSEYYELAYLKKLDSQKVADAKQLLVGSGLLSKNTDDVAFTNIINEYATRASYNNLLYFPLYLSIRNKLIANRKERKSSAYIQKRSIKLKTELIAKLKEM